MNNSQWDRLKLAHYQSSMDASLNDYQSSTTSMKCKFVGPNNQLLSLAPDICSSHKVIRHLRIYCKSTFEFVEEIPLEETNKKYLCRIFNLAPNDELLLSYRVKNSQKKYIRVLANRELDLEHFDYFMEVPLSA